MLRLNRQLASDVFGCAYNNKGPGNNLFVEMPNIRYCMNHVFTNFPRMVSFLCLL